MWIVAEYMKKKCVSLMFVYVDRSLTTNEYPYTLVMFALSFCFLLTDVEMRKDHLV